MKNKFISILLIMVFLVALAGCGQSKTANDDPSTQTSENTSSEETSSETTESSQDSAQANSDLATQYPLTLQIYNVDGELVDQTYEKAPEKVVPYTASAVVTMLELGLEDCIAGIMAPDNAPPEKWQSAYENLNVLGDKTSVSKETIIALEPDMVFGRTMSLSDDIYGTVESFNEMNINVYSQKSSSFSIDQSLDNIIEDILNLGKIFDVQERAEEYAQSLRDRVEKVEENTASANSSDEPLKAILMVRYDSGNFSTFGSNSTLQNAALGVINVENIVDGVSGQITDENLVALNPDIIVYVTAERNAEFDAVAKDAILNNELLADVTAVKDQKYIEIPYETLMDYGPSIFDAIEIIYEGVYND